MGCICEFKREKSKTEKTGLLLEAEFKDFIYGPSPQIKSPRTPINRPTQTSNSKNNLFGIQKKLHSHKFSNSLLSSPRIYIMKELCIEFDWKNEVILYICMNI